MTVEIEYSLPAPRAASTWQVSMAEQIESNRGFPIESIQRQILGTTLIVTVETSLPSTAAENTLSDIEDHLDTGSEHVETREV